MNENRKLRAMMLAQQTLIRNNPTTGMLTLRMDDSGESHGCVSFDIYLDDKKLIGFREMKKETIRMSYYHILDITRSDKINALLTTMGVAINCSIYLAHRGTDGGAIDINDYITVESSRWDSPHCQTVAITEDMCVTIFDRVLRVIRPTVECSDESDSEDSV